MDLDKKNKRLKILKNILSLYLLLIIVGVFGMILSFITKKSPCVLYSLTGIPCPSCGITRAVESALVGRVKMAFFYHPLFFLLPFIPLLPILQNKNEKAHNLVLVTLILIFIIIWILRLYFYFPKTPPMNFNSEAFFPKIFGYRF